MIDSHCHWDDPIFQPDLPELCQRSSAAGVQACIIPAVSSAHWGDVLRLSRQISAPRAYPALGMHPSFAQDTDAVEHLRHTLQEHPEVVAIGECGLDFVHSPYDRAQQMRLFEAQIILAQDFDLPLIVHHRRSLEDLLHMLRRHAGIRFLVHSFSGSDAQLATLLDLGGEVGVGGSVSYPRAQRLRRQIARLPLDRLHLETDAPWQPLCGHQGQRNEPARLADIARCVAVLRGEDLQMLQEQSATNTRRFFGIA